MKSFLSVLLFSFSQLALAQAFPWVEMEDQRIHVPSNILRPAPVMVMLHGCLQNSDSFAVSTQMNRVADKYGFVVLYPDQSRVNNPLKCWNWFQPENHNRLPNNEMAVILELLNLTVQSVQIDVSRIYVAGLSAGGGMTANLLGCYSDIFAGGAIHSGVAFGAADSVGQAQSVMANPQHLDSKKLADKAIACVGEKGRTIPVLALHGVRDNIVKPGHSQVIIEQFARYNDYFDDGSINGSVSDQVFSAQDYGNATKHATLIMYNRGQAPHHAMLLVDEMDHAWSGGKSGEQYSDPLGPNASELIWNFVKDYRNPRFF